jgi:PiT family inorganic phosphate transporter
LVFCEYLKHSDAKRIEEIKAHHEHDAPEIVDEFLRNFKKASIERTDA